MVLSEEGVFRDLLASIVSAEEIGPFRVEFVNSVETGKDRVHLHPKVPIRQDFVSLNNHIEIIVLLSVEFVHPVLDKLGVLLDVISVCRAGEVCKGNEGINHLLGHSLSC